jgi:hypothetical protein
MISITNTKVFLCHQLDVKFFHFSNIYHRHSFLVGNTSSMNLIPQTSTHPYLQFTSHDPSTNLLTYNCHQTWSSNDDNSNSSLINKTTRRRNTTIVPNGPKRPVGRPPKKAQQQKPDEIILQQSESNSLIEQPISVRYLFLPPIKNKLEL